MSENKKNDEKKLWGGRFSGKTSSVSERLSSSIEYDSRMYRQDIRGSISHAKMLNKMGILNEKELSDIIAGLTKIEGDISSGNFDFQSSLEDIHMNIESKLTERIGEAGKKLHTARSRNDQVATDVRLYIKDESLRIRGLLTDLINVFIVLAEENMDVIIPGYTHLQVAQPVRLSQHLLAYAWKFLRDRERLDFAVKQSDSLPLGVGALAGVNYQNDREFLKEDLSFSDIVYNSMDAVSNRDFILDFLYFASVAAVHMSRLSEELVLWSTSEFGFIRLSDAVTTGSSIMPQKRNPDMAELIRGKSGRVFGNLISMLTVLKGLPLTYNRDLQEDKEPLFDSIDTVEISILAITEMVATMEINRDVAKKAVYSNFSTATDIADYLTKKGVPFRESHSIVGSIVRDCEEKDRDFFTLKIEELKYFSSYFDDDIIDIINPEKSTERKLSLGSTAIKEIKSQIEILKKRVLAD